MSRVRIGFLGTPEFAKYALESVLADEHFEVVGVVTQPDKPSGRKLALKPSPVKEFALAHSLKCLTPQKASDPAVLSELKSWGAEAMVVVAYGQILSQDFLNLWPNKVVNLHASCLPRWRGAAPIQRAIEAGDEETGVSLQVMVKQLDAGAVLGERRIRIAQEWTSFDLHDRLQVLGVELLRVELMDYLRGNLAPIAQEETKITYAHKLKNEEAAVNWTLPSRVIFNQVRGFAMGPGKSTQTPAHRLKIHRAEVDSELGVHAAPGRVHRVEKDFVIVECGLGTLKLLEVQPESKAKMKVSDYLRGSAVKVGDLWT